MSELPVPAANKSVTLAFESVEEFLADRRKLRALLNYDSVQGGDELKGLQQGIEEFEQATKELLPAIASKIVAAKRPINPSELATELAMIVAAFPNGKANEDFVAILINSVAIMQPSIGAVRLARRHLIFNAKFLPAISEVREAIKAAMAIIADFEGDVRWVPRRLESMKSRQAQLLNWAPRRRRS